MAKDSIRDYSATSSNNSDIQSVDISEGCAPSGLNNAIREVMADLKDVSAGTVALETPVADSFSTDTISEKTSAAGVTIDSVLLKDNTVTATSFTGNGSALTNLTSGNLTGALPAIDGSNLTGVGGTTPAFCATRNSEQTSNSGSATTLALNVELLDSDGKYNTSNYRFTPTVAGHYYLFAQASNQNLNSQAELRVFIRKNGSTIAQGHVAGNNSSSNRDYTVNCAIVIEADTDDYFDAEGFQSLSNGQQIATTQRAFFLGFKVA